MGSLKGKSRNRALKKYYKSLPIYKNKWKHILRIHRFKNSKTRILYLRALSLVIADILSGKKRRKFGIYQFVALPGEGKTMSMVAHMERYRLDMQECKKVQGIDYIIATNFGYRNQDYYINHWTDIIKISKKCYQLHIPCVIAIDEIHITFDSSDWKDFPPEMLALLSFNRKFALQFLCSSQIYERIPKKVRDIANFTVICKNIGHFDRLFRCYYFEKNDYESQFDGKRKRAKFIKEFVSDDKFYSLYDTLAQVERMTETASKEKDLKQKAFEVLFGESDREADTAEESGAFRSVASGHKKNSNV